MDQTIPQIYAEKVRTQRTRSFAFDIPEKECRAEIIFTLLGIELKIGSKRFACPELSTARYLRIFARIGCQKIAVPYDITKISLLADELEMAWQTFNLLLEKDAADSSPRSVARRRSLAIKKIRREIEEIGAGDLMPVFDRETRQRR